MYSETTKCRICGNTELVPVLNLGQQALTGVFPASRDEPVTAGPLELVKCWGREDACGLLQLRQSYDIREMYGINYGYRSGLNSSMVAHLRRRANRILDQQVLRQGDVVVDIGSNDSTLLGCYPKDLTLIGFDPTGVKLRQYYPPHVQLVADFFSAAAYNERLPKKARVVTSFSMFYDLEDPLAFVQQVSEILADDGIWVIEQSYMPAMLEVNAFDTICHEHLEYYGVAQIQWLTERVGLEIIDVEFNDVNGGSFALVMAKRGARTPSPQVAEALAEEQRRGFDTLAPFKDFCERLERFREVTIGKLEQLHRSGSLAVGYGASTKGNVLLQFCGITERLLPCIGEINSDKYGHFTPGTLIPIVSEAEAKARNPEYLFVLPWHFHDYFVEKEADFLSNGGKLLFPLPELEIVSAPRVQASLLETTKPSI